MLSWTHCFLMKLNYVIHYSEYITYAKRLDLPHNFCISFLDLLLKVDFQYSDARRETRLLTFLPFLFPKLFCDITSRHTELFTFSRQCSQRCLFFIISQIVQNTSTLLKLQHQLFVHQKAAIVRRQKLIRILSIYLYYLYYLFKQSHLNNHMECTSPNHVHCHVNSSDH